MEPTIKPAETNMLYNNDLKEMLIEKAAGLLEKGKDYDELVNAVCNFGYIYMIEGHGIEALFRITTDKTVAYFEAKKSTLMRISYVDEKLTDQEMFENDVRAFLEQRQ